MPSNACTMKLQTPLVLVKAGHMTQTETFNWFSWALEIGTKRVYSGLRCKLPHVPSVSRKKPASKDWRMNMLLRVHQPQEALKPHRTERETVSAQGVLGLSCPTYSLPEDPSTSFCRVLRIPWTWRVKMPPPIRAWIFRNWFLITATKIILLKTVKLLY